MPRTRRPPAGAGNQGGYSPGQDPGGGAQPPRAPTGMPYGEHQASVTAQRQIPLPGGGAPGATAPAAPQPPASAPPGAGGLAAALMQAQQMAPPHPDGILAPTGRPTEPVTAGLGVGPGPGPEALGQVSSPMVDLLQRISASNGDPRLRQIADQARMLTGQP